MTVGEGKKGVKPISSEDEGVLSVSVAVLKKRRNKVYSRRGKEEKKDLGLDSKTAKGRVIIIKPQGKKNRINKFLGSSMQVSTLLVKSEFKKEEIMNVWSSFKFKYLTIEIKKWEYMGELLKVNNLRKHKIHCLQSVSYVEVKGVIEALNSEKEKEINQ